MSDGQQNEVEHRATQDMRADDAKAPPAPPPPPLSIGIGEAPPVQYVPQFGVVDSITYKAPHAVGLLYLGALFVLVLCVGGAFSLLFAAALVALVVSGTQVHPTVFVAATVAWFAFGALLCAIITRVLMATIAEIRSNNSREYLRSLLRIFLSLGVNVDSLIRLAELGFRSETGVADSHDLAATPVLRTAEAIKDIAKSAKG